MKNVFYTQNFLNDDKLVKSLVDNSNIRSGDTVIEIGSGKGIITKYLINKVDEKGKVVSIEIDKKLYSRLNLEFREVFNVQLLNIDVRDYDFKSLKNFKVFSNIPFIITSDIMNILLDININIKEGYVIIQKEAASMYAGEAIDCPNNLKSLLALPNFYFRILHTFKKSDFIPQPNVEVVLLHFKKRKHPLVVHENFLNYRDFITFLSGNRVGEGNWVKLLSIKKLIESKSFSFNFKKGIGQQKLSNFLKLYEYLELNHPDKLKIFKSYFEKLEKKNNKLPKINRTRIYST